MTGDKSSQRFAIVEVEVRNLKLQDANETAHVQKNFRNPNPTGLGESTAVHLQLVRQDAPHLYRCTFLASKP